MGGHDEHFCKGDRTVRVRKGQVSFYQSMQECCKMKLSDCRRRGQPHRIRGADRSFFIRLLTTTEAFKSHPAVPHRILWAPSASRPDGHRRYTDAAGSLPFARYLMSHCVSVMPLG
ncbi:hypothetical protein Y032_0156g3145 [Ancylostoma ceylanicum]|uniref:Uncharacterized protein n=1 Tax=Ancylostoma ceylanicum TaxID=53326 RepID=A0A016SZG8_9BILA|nr:hypothetical protein Y032_0156g3145 [Ancylostoma ceylanicum]